MTRWKEGGLATFRPEFWLAAIVALFAFLPSAGAIQAPDVTFIPDKISINSSFIMIADAHPTTGEYISVGRWIVFGVDNGWGTLPRKIGEKRASYLSNTDPDSDNPNPFPAPSYGVPYELEVNLTSNYGQTGSTLLNVNVGSIPINTKIDVVGSTVYMQAWAGAGVESISYKTYYAGTLELVPQKSGFMTYNHLINGFNTSISLQQGDYFIAFSTSLGTDFGGGIAPVTIGGDTPVTNLSEVKVDSINYLTTIKAGQQFILKNFTITNTGTANLTGLSITIPDVVANYLDIDPEKTFLEPNESTYMVVTLNNIQNYMNISLSAPLYSGSKQITQIPVNLVIQVIGVKDYTTCEAKEDMEACISSGKPGVCCSEICRQFGQCCKSSDCTTAGETCSNFKCTTTITNQCQGQEDMSYCTGGICCTETCIAGGECCRSFDCPGYDESCVSNKCQTGSVNECYGKSDGYACTGGICCDGSCISGECCSDSDCESEKICNTFSNICESETPVPPSEGFDILTIAAIGGGVAIAALVGFLVFKRFRKKGEGEEEIAEEGGGEEDEFSDEDFY